jgi:uncharacterized protein YneF (UPF0154 family)
MNGIITFGDIVVTILVSTGIGAVIGSYVTLKLLKKV